MNPMELAAKKKGLKHLIKGMAIEMSKGRADTPLAAGGVKNAVGDAMKGAADEAPEHEEGEDQAEEALETPAEEAAEGADGEHGDEGTEEPGLHDQVKSFMQRPIHSNRPTAPGDKVVVRMIAGEARPMAAPSAAKVKVVAPEAPGKKNRFTGRR